MATQREFVSRVRELADGSPYVVEETASGCDVKLDIANAQWYTLMAKEGIDKTFTFHVRLDESAGTLSVTDDSQEVSWEAGAEGQPPQPTVRKSGTRTVGRVHEFSTRKTWAWGEDGEYGKQVDYAFSSGEGRALIDKVAEEQGWNSTMGGAEKVGLYVAIGAVVLVIVIVILLVVLL